MQPMENTDTRTTLLRLCSEKGTSLAALSALIGRNSSYLQQFVRKGSPRKLEEGTGGAWRDSLAWTNLLGGEITVPVKEKSSRLPASCRARRRLDGCAAPRARCLGGAGGAGGGQRRLRRAAFSQGWLRGMGLDPAHLSTIAVAGDSMWPLLNDGDEILVDHTRTTPRDGIHVVRVGDHLLVKRIDMGRRPRAPQSENPAYDPIDLDPEEVAVIGRVVWKGGRL
jgi:hypothetical protein